MWTLSQNGRKSFRTIDDAPFVVFIFTLLTLAVTCAVLAYYIMYHPISDPRVKDWNSFLDHFGRLEICLESNTEEFQKSALDAKFKDLAILKPNAKNESEDVAISLFLRFGMRNLNWFCSQNTSTFLLTFDVLPKQIGLISEDEPGSLRVSFVMTRYQFDSACVNNATDTSNFTVSTCVRIAGSSTVLPTTGHHEQCLNEQDPESFYRVGNSTKYSILRPLVVLHVLQGSMLAELSSGGERRVCNHGGILASPKFISNSDVNSILLPPDICRAISFRLLMSAVILVVAVPLFVILSHLCRRLDNSHLLMLPTTPVPYSPLKLSPPSEI